MSRTRHRIAQLLAFTAIVALATAALGQTTSDERPPDCSAYESIPLPAEAEEVPVPKTPPACASYRSYRGIGRRVNYSEARVCAWQERLAQNADLGQNQKEPVASFVGGSLILADIYFNGAGVERNIPLAIRFACESDEGIATLALRNIAKSKGSSSGSTAFEFCDYASTTIAMTFCSRYASHIEDDRRNRFYNSLKSSMTPAQRAAFEKLLAAHNAYIEAHASEVYQGGTIRGIRTMSSQNILKDLFHTDVIHFERKKWPALSAAQITTADTLTRREHDKTLERLRKHTKEEIDEGAVSAEDLSKVEPTWETYRDAWVAFARLRYPAKVTAIRAQITLDRYRLLKTIY
jgi:hypothetical protein